METIRKDLKEFQWTDWLVMVMTTGVFLPHTVCMAVLLGCCIAVAVKGGIKMLVEKSWEYYCLYAFLLLEIIVCTFYKNWDGLLIIIGFVGVFLYTGFYRKTAHKKLLIYLIEWALILSLLTAVLGLIQFNHVSQLGGYSFWDFEIQNSPKRRITGTFQNANIYAMILELVLICSFFRFLCIKNWKRRFYYMFVAGVQFFMILLTGCRAALVPIVFIIPLMLAMHKKKRMLMVYCGLFTIAAIAVFMKPDLIPRIDDISTIQSRVKIWKCAVEGIKEYPLFGNGPWTYHRIYPQFHGHKAVHSHNIYLDCVLSFGIIGCTLLAGYVIGLLKDVWSTYKKDRLLFSLMGACFLVIGIHGLVDGTIHPIKVMLLFMMIVNLRLKPQETV